MNIFWIIFIIISIISALYFVGRKYSSKNNENIVYEIIEYFLPTDSPELQILEYINRERLRINLFPLKIDVKTSQLAKRRNLEMIEANLLSHELMDDERGELVILGADFVGENIAYGFNNIDALMREFMKSDGHRKNILSPNYDWCGIAITANDDLKNYYCILFGGDNQINKNEKV